MNEYKNNQVYGEVPYWSIQHSGFSELPSIQVLKLNPNKVWNCYLSGKKYDNLFSLIKRSPTRNYLFKNKNNESFLQNNDDNKHILVGFIRNDYFNHIEEKIKKGLDNFVFYFYATGIEKNSQRFIRYPLHPYIDSSKEIILYTDDKSRFINGFLRLTRTGRCQIDEVRSDELNKKLLNIQFKKSSENAKTYYVMEVERISISNKPYESIANFSLLEKYIKYNELNDVLFKSSPKIINF